MSNLSPRLLRHPVHFLSLGFGAGLSPVAPGTAGTLAAIPVYLLLAQWTWPVYVLLTLALLAAGIWLCGQTSRELGGKDHPAIVWDEITGFLITMIGVPPEPVAILAGFLLFRLFDILKPWPIRVLDRSIGGGWGIMLDDVLAGLFAMLALRFIVLPNLGGLS